jgi:cytochrome b subunit of formate dehydrogenase
VEILGELRKVVGEKSIFFHPHTHQYGVHIQKFKQFVKPEIALHWVNGLPFLVLMLTGAVMLASRFWHIDRGMFVIVHEVFAAEWVIGLPLTVLVHAKIHWQHIRIVLTWGRDDLLWMTQSFRSVYNKNITPPPAARFNTGQKINALLVFVYFFGFSATGVLMFFKGSILFPWYVHTALFFSAMGSVGGHLHLALLNPSTRLRRLAFFTAGRPSNTSGIITR